MQTGNKFQLTSIRLYRADDFANPTYLIGPALHLLAVRSAGKISPHHKESSEGYNKKTAVLHDDIYIIALFLHPRFRNAVHSLYYKFDDTFEEKMGKVVCRLGFSDKNLFKILDMAKQYSKGEAQFNLNEKDAKKF